MWIPMQLANKIPTLSSFVHSAMTCVCEKQVLNLCFLLHLPKVRDSYKGKAGGCPQAARFVKLCVDF